MAQAAGAGRAMVSMLASAGLALISACTSPSPPPPAPAPPEANAAPPPATDERLQPHGPPRPARKPAARMASLPPPSSAEANREDGGFDQLHGLDAAGTVALLGEPRQRAESPPAILWRYASRDCDLDVYFYLDLQSREMRVLHYEVRDHDDGAERTQPKCYRELVAERRAEQDGSTGRPR